jgi:hypothetical protein
MIYEKHTLTGELELTDSVTGQIVTRRLTLICEKPCRLCQEPFMEGEGSR